MEACDLRWTLPSLDLQMVESRRRRVMMILLWFSFLPAQRRRALIDCRPINNALFKYDSLMLLFFIFSFSFLFYRLPLWQESLRAGGEVESGSGIAFRRHVLHPLRMYSGKCLFLSFINKRKGASFING